MKKSVDYSVRNLEIASDLIARKYRVRDEYLLGQPFYLDLLTYVVDVFKVLLPPKAHVLEVSCGTGVLAELLLKELRSIVLDVSDISEETLTLVKKRTQRFGNRITFIKKDNSTCSFSGRYDAVCTNNAMRLTFVDYSRLYRNFYNILKRNGIVLIGEAVVPLRKGKILTKIGEEVNDAGRKPNTYERWAEFASNKGFTDKVDKEDISRVVRFYSPRFHIEKLKGAGFREVEVIYRKYHHAIIAGMKGKLSFNV